MSPAAAAIRTLVLLFALGTAASPAAAQRTLDIRQFAADLLVRRDGTLDVKESITVEFQGEWNGLYREIPVHARTPQGFDYRLDLRVRGASDDAGNALRYDLERGGGNLRVKVWVPGARDAVRTVVLEYRVRNAIRFFEEHDELYWNVTGTDWGYPIRAASADVYLPEEVAGLRSNSFTGPYGSQGAAAATEQVGNLMRFRTRAPLDLREGLTVVVAWNPGVVERPTAFDRAGGFLRSNLLLLAPLLALAAMFPLWRRFGRDPELGAIAPQYEPPERLTPAEAGTLIDLRVDMRDLSATLVDLAVRGYIRIEETEREQLLGLLRNRDYQFVLLRPRTDFGALKEHERDLLLAVFDADDSVALSSLENRFYRKLPGITDSLKHSLVADGYYVHNPTTIRALYLAAAVVTGALVTVLGAWLATRYPISMLTIAAGALLTALVVGAFGWQMPARTARGTRTLRHLRGFEEFLERVESERFARVIDSPELFEKYLPFAMAFGVEKRWAAAFKGLLSSPPDWYRSSHGGRFHTAAFASDLGRLSAATGSTLSSAPRSSSSGSSGMSGGFSGGGFGGGGGGGF